LCVADGLQVLALFKALVGGVAVFNAFVERLLMLLLTLVSMVHCETIVSRAGQRRMPW